MFELTLASAVILAGALYGLSVARRSAAVNMLDLCVLSTCLFFGVGGCVAFACGSDRWCHEYNKDCLTAYVSLYIYLATLMVSSALLIGLKSRYRIGAGEHRGIFSCWADAYQAGSTSVFASYLVVFMVRAILAVVYGISINSTATLERNLALPYSMSILSFLIQNLAAGCYIWAISTILAKGDRRMWAWIIAAVELGLATVSGRELMLYLALIAGAIYVTRQGAVNFKVAALTAVAVLVLVQWVFPLFLSMRYHFQHGNSDSLAGVSEAVMKALDPEQGSETEELYRSNMSERPHIIRFNFDIAHGQETMDVLGGESILASVIWTIPSAIYQEKRSLVVPEQIVQLRYGLLLNDATGNWPAYGLADFGMAGGVVAALILAACLSLGEVLSFALYAEQRFVSICWSGMMFYLAFSVDNEPMKAFVTIRDLVLISLVFYAVSRLFKGRA